MNRSRDLPAGIVVVAVVVVSVALAAVSLLTTHAIASLRCMINSGLVMPGWPHPSPLRAGLGYFMPWKINLPKLGMTQGEEPCVVPK